MKTTHRSRRSALLAAAAVVLALSPVLAPAQGIYRIVGPDGRITFSDKPPTSSEKATALSPSGRSTENGAASELPFELREAMNRYPVTLYTGDDCSPCNAGRTLLNSRGIPFAERTIRTPKDAEALKNITREESLPLLTIGGQLLKGFSATEWDQYLNAAGYPQTSILPNGYRNSQATPLVPLPEGSPAQAEQQQPQPALTPPPPGPSPSNPTGIVF